MEARDSFCFPKNTKNPNPSPIGKKFGFCCCGAPPGTRTLGPLIKSQLLYQLDGITGPLQGWDCGFGFGCGC